MRWVLLFIAMFATLFCSTSSQAQVFRRSYGNHLNSNGRYCNDPNCAMCNRLFGYMPGYEPRPTYQPTYQPPVVRQTVSQPTIIQPVVSYTVPVVSSPLPSAANPIDLHKVVDSLDPTPTSAVNKMLMLLKPSKDDILCDLGSGDGRILIEASKLYGTRGIGVEINPTTAELSRTLIKQNGITNITVLTHDAAKISLEGVTIITMYLYPPVIAALMPNLMTADPGTKIISYNHPIPGVNSDKIIIGTDTFYLWIK